MTAYTAASIPLAERTAVHFGSSVLIVDDEPHVRQIMVRWLDAEGLDCATAADAEEALQHLAASPFSLLITDVSMPGQSGLDLLRIVRERFPETAVLIATAVDDKKTAIRAVELGAYGYVIKPFDRNEVIINVVNALERRRLAQQSLEYEHRLEERVREQTREIRASQEEIVLRLLATSEYHHDETGAHIRRIGLYSEVLAAALGHPSGYTEMIRLAGPMHDIGKVGIPDAILMKPGRLDSDEWATMRTHTTIGARILGGTKIPLLHMAEQIALCHQEKWDGSGYPYEVSGKDIPEPARIVAVVDVYDALTHNRVYRAALPEEEALSILAEGRGTHFDPDVYDAFLRSLPQLRAIVESTVYDP